MLQMQPLLAREHVNKLSQYQEQEQFLFTKMADIAMLHLRTLVH
jgi:hypothetical protein